MEIERRWKIAGFPENLPLLRQAHMRQGYIATAPVVRIRTDGARCVLCFKGKGTLAREEIETDIDAETFRRLEAFIGKPLVSKDYRVYALPDGRRLQFARGSIGCVIDNTLRSMYCEVLHRSGQLLVSVEWFCRYLYNLTVTECDGVVYVTDHFAELSANMADLIRDLLRGGGVSPDLDALTTGK